MIYTVSLFSPFPRDVVREHLFCFFVQLNSTSVLSKKFFLRIFFTIIAYRINKKITKIKMIVFYVCV